MQASPEEVTAIYPDDGLVSATNQFNSKPMQEYQSSERTPAVCSRYRGVTEWFDEQDREISARNLQTEMGDPEVGVCWPVDEQHDNPRLTIWSWIIDPANRVGYLASESPVETPYKAVRVPK